MCGPRVAADVQRLAFAADEFYGIHDRWPSHAELLAIDDSMPERDVWGHEYTFEFDAEGHLQVRSPGVDERRHTADDIVSWVMRGGQRFEERQVVQQLLEERAARERAGERPRR